MPKPHGTFLRTQSKDAVSQAAKDDKKKLSTADDKRRQEFYKALDKHSASELTSWLKQFQKLKERLAKQQRAAQTDDDEDLKVEVRIVRHLKEILSKAKDSSEFTAVMGRDANTVIRANPSNLPGTWDLALVIAVLSILEVILRMRKSK